MCNTRGSAAVAALRKRVCLFAPSVTVCAEVCTAHDLRATCMQTPSCGGFRRPHAGGSESTVQRPTVLALAQDAVTSLLPSGRTCGCMVEARKQVRVLHVQHKWRCCCCRAETESVPLCTFSDSVWCGVCTSLDLRAACRSLCRAVVVLHIHTRLGASRQHSGQRC
jgi:hypothetical protein